MLKFMLKILSVLLLILFILAIFNIENIKRLVHALKLFDEDRIVENFQHMDQSFETRLIQKSVKPFSIPKKDTTYQLPKEFSWKDKRFRIEEYLKYSRTTGLMVIHKDSILLETYDLDLKAGKQHISWSVAKSFVSALLGIAHQEGLFDSVDDPVTKYLPKLKSTPYNNVKIKDILQMSTGVAFDEDYKNLNSDISKFGRYFALGWSYEKFIMKMRPDHEPGTFNNYVSLNTQVLGMLLVKITGKSLSEYLKLKVWDPLGMQDDARWIIDETGMEMALGGLNVSLRDYAKMGLLFLNNGNWNGQQIIPAQWIKDSVTPDAPHLQPGVNKLSSSEFGYSYQWWIPEDPDGDFFASGIYNQYIYVNPKKDVVIVKTSANHHFKEIGDQSKSIHISMFQEIAAQF